MKLNINFNWVTALIFIIFAITIVVLLQKVTEYQMMQNDFQKYVQLTSPVLFDYNCDGVLFQSSWYQCGEPYKNLTGHYCIYNGTYTLVCENKWRMK